MITDKLIALLDAQADGLTTSWIRLLRENNNVPYFRGLDDQTLTERAHFIYEQLKLWLDWQTSSHEVARLFWQLGAERKSEGVLLSEIHYSLILARRNLYINILEKMGDEEDTGMSEVIAFTSRITYFFDKASYFVAKGYEGKGAPSAEDESVLDDILTAFRAGASLSK